MDKTGKGSSKEYNLRPRNFEPHEYNLRPRKRRRLNNGLSSEDESTRKGTACKRKNPIMHMPTEVLQHIFQYISFHELSSTVRLVNRRFKCIAENSLNRSLKEIERKLKTLKEKTSVSLYAANEETHIKTHSKCLYVLELLQFLVFKPTTITVHRYIFNEFYKVPNTSCIYAGLLIDRMQQLVLSLSNVKNRFPTFILCNLANVINMTKYFCNHFERVIEGETPKSIFYSGCKIVDILDTALYARKTIIKEEHTSDHFTAQYSYSFHNSWFVGLPIPINTILSPQDNQRLMHMRLRRIVLAHSEMYHKQMVFERELAMHVATDPPKSCVYTGYGDTEDIFFYYGVMNNASYFNKFQDQDVDEHDNENEDNINNQVDEIRNQESDEAILYRINHLGFTITVIVNCPLVCAPINYLRSQKIVVDEEFSKTNLKRYGKEVSLIIEYPGACYPQLPSKYEGKFKSRL